MHYLLDTVTIIRHFSGQGRLGRNATLILSNIEQSNDVFMISVISLMEIMYLAEKNRITLDLSITLERLARSSAYQIINLTPVILQVAQQISFPELHDRLIIATAQWLEIPIISSDSKFSHVPGVTVVWE